MLRGPEHGLVTLPLAAWPQQCTSFFLSFSVSLPPLLLPFELVTFKSQFHSYILSTRPTPLDHSRTKHLK